MIGAYLQPRQKFRPAPDVIRPDRTKSMNLAPWNAGIDDPWKHATPLKSYRAKFGRSRSNGTPILTDIRRKKIDPLVPPFTVTQGHWYQHE